MRKYLFTCFLLFSAIILIGQVPTPNPKDRTICVGSTLVFGDTSIDPAAVYSFTIDNGETITNISANTQGQVLFENTGTYNVTITKLLNGCTINQKGTIIVQPNGILTAQPITQCVDVPNVIINGQPAGTIFTPTNGGTVAGNIFTPNNPGAYTLNMSYTASNGCLSTGTVNITINPLPTINLQTN